MSFDSIQHATDPPVISVITAVYNAEKYIEQAIESVLGQTYPNVELIVIDGGSTDATVEKIKKYSGKLYYWTSEKDNGVYDAWNKGLAKANGEWITFLGADDFFWNKDVLKDIAGKLQVAMYCKIRYVYGKVNLLSESGRILNTLGKPWEESKRQMMHRMSVVHCASFHHRMLFAENGQFNVQFKIAGDYEFLLREFVKGKDALFVDQIIAGMRVGGLSANIRLRHTVAKEEIQARKLNNLRPTFAHKTQVIKARLALVLIRILGTGAVNNISDLLRVIGGKEKMWSNSKD